jgi:hypothetical protein
MEYALNVIPLWTLKVVSATNVILYIPQEEKRKIRVKVKKLKK